MGGASEAPSLARVCLGAGYSGGESSCGQEPDPNITSQFDLPEAVLEAMARQARRSLRSLSESSSLSTNSLSSLTSLSSSGESRAGDFERSERAEVQTQPPLQTESRNVEASSVLGKRKRKRNSEKEADRRVKRQRANPRKRGRSKKERIDRSKVRQAMRQAVQSQVLLTELRPDLNVDRRPELFDLEVVKSMGVKVVQWDGM